MELFSLKMTLQLGLLRIFPMGNFTHSACFGMTSICFHKWNFCRREHNAVKELKGILHRQA